MQLHNGNRCKDDGKDIGKSGSTAAAAARGSSQGGDTGNNNKMSEERSKPAPD